MAFLYLQTDVTESLTDKARLEAIQKKSLLETSNTAFLVETNSHEK